MGNTERIACLEGLGGPVEPRVRAGSPPLFLPTFPAKSEITFFDLERRLEMGKKASNLMGVITILIFSFAIYLIVLTYTEPDSTPPKFSNTQPPSSSTGQVITFESAEAQTPSSTTGPFTSITPNPEMQPEQNIAGWCSIIEGDVKHVLGSSNRNRAKVYKVEEEGDNIRIIFAIDDNLTDGWIKDGAKSDITKILQTVQPSGNIYSEIIIWGTFGLSDKYGNSAEEIVLKVSYTPATIKKINWDNFLSDNVYDIADSVWQHPAFR